MRIDFAAISPSVPIVVTLILLTLVIIITVPILLTTAIAVRFRRSLMLAKGNGGPGYVPVPLLTPAERSFFGVLQQATEYTIFAKVRLADIIHPGKSSSRSAWQSAFNRIACKHVDFVLCAPDALRVVAVVELDDSTHGRFERGVRDGLVDAALTNAGISVLRVPAARSYSLLHIRQEIERLVRSPVPTA